MLELEFDEPTHVYRWNGKVVPNVTSVLAPMIDLSRIQPDVLENARQEGQAIHQMVEFDAQGDLDESTLPDWLHPRFTAWRKFLADTGFKILGSERRVYHKVYQYAGTLDLLGTMNGEPAIIDIKRSLLAGPVTGLQTSAYAGAIPEKIQFRGALQLRDDGTYRLERFADRTDFSVFLSLLTVFNWKRTHQ